MRKLMNRIGDRSRSRSAGRNTREQTPTIQATSSQQQSSSSQLLQPQQATQIKAKTPSNSARSADPVANASYERHRKRWQEALDIAAAQPEWERYCKILEKEQSNLSVDEVQASHSGSIDGAAVAEVANNAKDRDEASGRLSGSIGRFFDILVQVKDIGNTLAALNPYAALGWGVAQFVAGTVSNNSRIRDLCWSNLPAVEATVNRCKILEDLYSNLTGSSDLDETEINDKFTDLFACIIQYQVAVVVNKYSKREHVKNALTAKEQSRPEELLNSIKTKEDFLLQQYNLLHKHGEVVTFQRLLANDAASLKAMETRFDKLEADLKDIKTDTSMLVTFIQEREREQILKWIHSDEHSATHIRQEVEPGTCDWLFKTQEYSDWCSGQSNSILWLRGKMGAGKSHLIHHAIESHLTDKTMSNTKMAYAYFGETTDVHDMLRKLVRQLANSCKDDSFPTRIVEDFNEKPDNRPPSREKCLEWMKILAEDADAVCFIFDALDELSKHHRTDFVSFITSWLEQDSQRRRVVISSRDQTDMYDIFDNLPFSVSEIDVTKHNKASIDKFIESKIKSVSKTALRSKYVVTTRGTTRDQTEEVIETLCRMADGMFRWADLAISWLNSSKTFEALSHRLQNLKATNLIELNDLYDKIYEAMMEDVEPSEEIAIRTIICFCLESLNEYDRPLTTLTFDHQTHKVKYNHASCILEACMRIADADQNLYRVVSNEEDMPALCPDFIAFERWSAGSNIYAGSIALYAAHLSVKEYLTERHADIYAPAAMHAFLATICIETLLKMSELYVETSEDVEKKASPLKLDETSESDGNEVNKKNQEDEGHDDKVFDEDDEDNEESEDEESDSLESDEEEENDEDYGLEYRYEGDSDSKSELKESFINLETYAMNFWWEHLNEVQRSSSYLEYPELKACIEKLLFSDSNLKPLKLWRKFRERGTIFYKPMPIHDELDCLKISLALNVQGGQEDKRLQVEYFNIRYDYKLGGKKTFCISSLELAILLGAWTAVDEILDSKNADINMRHEHEHGDNPLHPTDCDSSGFSLAYTTIQKWPLVAVSEGTLLYLGGFREQSLAECLRHLRHRGCDFSDEFFRDGKRASEEIGSAYDVFWKGKAGKSGEQAALLKFFNELNTKVNEPTLSNTD